MSKQQDATALVSGRLLDEVEQLRTALESALEENHRLAEDRDRLRTRVTALSRELQAVRVPPPPPPSPPSAPMLIERQTQAEEELRVAFEELQVLTEELEIANTSLHQANRELDARVEERTRQIREINAALRATEGSLRTLADLVPDLLWRKDSAGDADWFNQRWYDYTGHDPAEPLGKGWVEAFHPLDRDAALGKWAQVVETGATFEHELRIRGAAGDYRWFLVRAEPLRDDRHEIISWFASGTDMHEQRIAMEALGQSELRFRTLIEGMPQLVWRAVDGGQWTWSSPQWTDYTGLSEEASRAMGWLDAFHPGDRDAALAAWKRAQHSSNFDVEARIFHAEEGRHRHFRTRALPVRDCDGRILEWLGTSTDVDDILQLQSRQEVLVAELQHRTRNLMAVVQAITKRTLRDSPSLDHFRACIEERFQALARVQSLLSRREAGTRVTFDELIREELSAHVAIDAEGGHEQVTLAGPKGVPLKSAIVQTLALALHELATNAVKYGALARPGGHLEVSWDVHEPKPGERRLRIDWRERGVPGMPEAGSPPRGSGYGRELIERALPYQLGARTTFEFMSDGVHCTIDVSVPPSDQMTEQADG